MVQDNSKKYFIKTYGCQANIADSEKIAGILAVLGFEQFIPAQEFKNEKEEFLFVLPKVDLFIVNSCSVRQKSEDKVYGLGKTLKEIKEKAGKKPFVILAGCVVGSATSERPRSEITDLTAKTPWVDLYLNPSQIGQIPLFLEKAGQLKNAQRSGKTDLKTAKNNTENGKFTKAYVNISYGCDNFCTYCVVPYARGREVSRSREEILSEIGQLVKKGIKEVTLCGQNVNSWGLTPSQKISVRLNHLEAGSGIPFALPLANLIKEIHKIPEIEKIDFISSNPFDFTDDLIEIFKLPKVSKYLHIAVQSGNNDILQKMNRKHTVEDFLTLINKIKKVCPNIEFGTDIIVGFPSETREQFFDTVKLFQTVDFAVAYIAMYSPRKGTAATKLYIDDVPASEKKWRHAHLTKIWRESKKSKKGAKNAK